MCLILVAWRTHPRYPCVIAANRDEAFIRASSPAGWWAESPDILAGRDLQAGGTWLGMTRGGRFAALTNFRGPQDRREDAPSRGQLVTEILKSRGTVDDGLQDLHRRAAQYNPFNLMFSDGEGLGVYESETGAAHRLGPGIYGLSNHLLDTPWPKVLQAKTRLRAALDDLENTAPMLALLRDDRPAAEGGLPWTGVDPAWERLLSSAFVRGAGYGTRCSTVIRVRSGGAVTFDEWTWDGSGAPAGHVNIAFQIAKP
jgi:uncharacterized protein with NRDE domain